MITDPKVLLASIKRCNAAYLVETEAAERAFEYLGAQFIGQYRNQNHQAVLSVVDGVHTLTITGTRFSEGPVYDRLGDLLSDIDIAPHDIGRGVHVPDGAYDGLGDMWRWALGEIKIPGLVNVEGHSLGGWRATYTPFFVPAERIGYITRFSPPKAGNDAFWQIYQDAFLSMATVAHGRDPWFGWPWISEYRQPPGQSIQWINGNKISVISEDEWPGGDPMHAADHGPTSIITALEQMTATPAA